MTDHITHPPFTPSCFNHPLTWWPLILYAANQHKCCIDSLHSPDTYQYWPPDMEKKAISVYIYPDFIIFSARIDISWTNNNWFEFKTMSVYLQNTFSSHTFSACRKSNYILTALTQLNKKIEWTPKLYMWILSGNQERPGMTSFAPSHKNQPVLRF